MKAAIIGLGQSGKTTVFRSLTGAGGASKETHGFQIGNVKVPDSRLERLNEIFKPPKIVHADVDFTDIVGGRLDQKGTGLSPQVVTEIRNADALIAVVRAFENPSVVHPLGTIDPPRDIKEIEAELGITDLIQIEKRLQKIERERSDGKEKELLVRAKGMLDDEKPLRLLDLSESESVMLSGFSFISQKPLLVLLNIDEEEIGKPPGSDVIELAAKYRYVPFQYCAEIELEISELEEKEQADFLREMGLEGSGRDRLLRKVYEMLRLVSFFTIGDNEIRAWSVERGTSAVKAAGKVHSDMERGFIRAEVINFEDFNEIGSMQKARETGHLRLEGKDYIVQDGDLIRFRFHV